MAEAAKKARTDDSAAAASSEDAAAIEFLQVGVRNILLQRKRLSCLCGRTFEKKDELTRHWTSDHCPGQQLRCTKCGLFLRNLDDYNKHGVDKCGGVARIATARGKSMTRTTEASDRLLKMVSKNIAPVHSAEELTMVIDQCIKNSDYRDKIDLRKLFADCCTYALPLSSENSEPSESGSSSGLSDDEEKMVLDALNASGPDLDAFRGLVKLVLRLIAKIGSVDDDEEHATLVDSGACHYLALLLKATYFRMRNRILNVIAQLCTSPLNRLCLLRGDGSYASDETSSSNSSQDEVNGRMGLVRALMKYGGDPKFVGSVLTRLSGDSSLIRFAILLEALQVTTNPPTTQVASAAGALGSMRQSSSEMVASAIREMSAFSSLSLPSGSLGLDQEFISHEMEVTSAQDASQQVGSPDETFLYQPTSSSSSPRAVTRGSAGATTSSGDITSLMNGWMQRPMDFISEPLSLEEKKQLFRQYLHTPSGMNHLYAFIHHAKPSDNGLEKELFVTVTCHIICSLLSQQLINRDEFDVQVLIDFLSIANSQRMAEEFFSVMEFYPNLEQVQPLAIELKRISNEFGPSLGVVLGMNFSLEQIRLAATHLRGLIDSTKYDRALTIFEGLSPRLINMHGRDDIMEFYTAGGELFRMMTRFHPSKGSITSDQVKRSYYRVFNESKGEHAALADSLRGYGSYLAQTNQFEEARRFLFCAYWMRWKLFGKDALLTIQTKYELANFFMDYGIEVKRTSSMNAESRLPFVESCFNCALRLFNHVERKWSEQLSKESAWVATCREGRARLHDAMDNWNESQRDLEACIQIRTKVFKDPNHERLKRAQASLAALLERRRRHTVEEEEV